MGVKINLEGAEEAGADPSLIEKAIEAVLKGENVDSKEISVLYISDEEIHTINREYLKHDFPTDVISFPMHENGNPVEGEIYISYETTLQNAERFGVSREQELLRVTIHGVLHLSGYDDADEASKSEMTERENHYLSMLD